MCKHTKGLMIAASVLYLAGVAVLAFSGKSFTASWIAFSLMAGAALFFGRSAKHAAKIADLAIDEVIKVEEDNRILKAALENVHGLKVEIDRRA